MRDLERLVAKAEVERVMHEIETTETLPDIVRVVRPRGAGVPTEVYGTRDLMEVSDYRYAIGYRAAMAAHYADSARAFAAECERVHGVPVPLPPWLPAPTPEGSAIHRQA